MGYIYIFVNLINFKAYIGKWCGKRVEDRRNDHKSGNGSQHLYNAIQKYGWENFIFDTLHENVPIEKLFDLERREIARFDCNSCRGGWGYNQTDGGDGSLGFVRSMESRQKQSKALTGRKLSEEHKRNVSEGLKGRVVLTETRQKLSESHRGENSSFYGKTGEKHPRYGRKFEPDAIAKMSEAKKGTKNPNVRPEYSQARWFFFFVLHTETNTKEKRQHFFRTFSDVPRSTLENWFYKWQKEIYQ